MMGTTVLQNSLRLVKEILILREWLDSMYVCGSIVKNTANPGVPILLTPPSSFRFCLIPVIGACIRKYLPFA